LGGVGSFSDLNRHDEHEKGGRVIQVFFKIGRAAYRQRSVRYAVVLAMPKRRMNRCAR
jgi:hypothetical protein